MISEMDDLCFRLRNAKVVEPKMPSEGYSTTLGKQAAERIEELEAENDKQRREIAELQTFLRGHQHNIGQLLKGREAPTGKTCPGCKMAIYDLAAEDGWCTDCNPANREPSP